MKDVTARAAQTQLRGTLWNSSSSSFSSSDNHHKMFGVSKEGWVALPASVNSLLLVLLMECHSISDLDSVHCTAKIALACLEASFFSWGKCTTSCRIGRSSWFVSLARRRGSPHPLLLSSLSEAPLSHFLPWKATSKCLWWEQRNRQSHVAVLEQAGCNINLWDWDETSGRTFHEVFFLSWNNDRRNLVDLHWGKTCTEAAAQGKECNWEKPEESVLVSFLFYLLQQTFSVLFPISKWEIFYIIFNYYIILHSRMGNTQSLSDWSIQVLRRVQCEWIKQECESDKGALLGWILGLLYNL